MSPESGPLLAGGRTAEVYPWDDDRVLKLLRTGFPDATGEAEAAAAALTASPDWTRGFPRSAHRCQG